MVTFEEDKMGEREWSVLKRMNWVEENGQFGQSNFEGGDKGQGCEQYVI